MYKWNEISFFNEFYKKTGQTRKDEKNLAYLPYVCSFKINASRITSSYSTMYIWTFTIKSLRTAQQVTVYGRTWNEFDELLQKIETEFSLHSYNSGRGRKIVVYCQKLSYEFSFLFGRKEISVKEAAFKNSKNDCFRCIINKYFDFRDTEIYSRMTFEDTAKVCSITIPEFDRDIIRTHETILTESELAYFQTETEIIAIYFFNELKKYNNKLTPRGGIPWTATGITRSYIRKQDNYKTYADNLQEIQQTERLDPLLGNLMKIAFNGAYAHSTPFAYDSLIEDVESFDLDSCYIYYLLAGYFPKMFKRTPCPRKQQQFIDMIEKRYKRRAYLIYIEFENIRPKDRRKAIYPLSAKSKNYDCGVGLQIDDESRLISADCFITAITDLDFLACLKFYDFDKFKIKALYSSYKQPLPPVFKNAVIEVYAKKEQLKTQKKKRAAEYRQIKEVLNSFFGICTQDRMKPNFQLADKQILKEEKLIEDINKYSLYSWGVWLTSYARYNLMMIADQLESDFIYCDTDSVKFTGEHNELINAYNQAAAAKIQREIINNDIFKGNDNLKFLSKIGQFEDEGKYSKFKTLGLKRYIYYNDEDGFTAKISGIDKKSSERYFNRFSTIDDKFRNFNRDSEIPVFMPYATPIYNNITTNQVVEDDQGHNTPTTEQCCCTLNDINFILTMDGGISGFTSDQLLEFAKLKRQLKLQ